MFLVSCLFVPILVSRTGFWFWFIQFLVIAHVFTFVLECAAKNKNIIMSSFKSSGDIQKKEGGPDSCFG